MKHGLIIAGIAVLLGLACFFTTCDIAVAPTEKAIDNTIVIVGDIMLDRNVAHTVHTHANGDYTFPFKHVAPLLSDADIAIGNLEGPISTEGTQQRELYAFRMHPDAINGLAYAGFDVVSLANNHASDWGRPALNDTLQRLATHDIRVIGAGTSTASTYEAQIIPLEHGRIALLGFSDFAGLTPDTHRSGIATNTSLLIDAIRNARERADIVMVYVHFGDEYESEPNAHQRELAHILIEEGVDIVIGSHPHVLQPLEIYQDKTIAYSLGNFIFDQDFSEETMTGGILSLTIQHKRIANVTLKKVQLNNLFQPVPQDGP